MLETRNPWEINQTKNKKGYVESKQKGGEILAGKVFFLISASAITIGVGLLGFIWLAEKMGMQLPANLAVGLMIPGVLLSLTGVGIGVAGLKLIVAYVRQTYLRIPAAMLLMVFSVGVGCLAIYICQGLDEYQGRHNPLFAVVIALGFSATTLAGSISLLRRVPRPNNKSITS